MRKILFHITNFREIHPILFQLGVFILFLLLVLLVYYIISSFLKRIQTNANRLLKKKSSTRSKGTVKGKKIYLSIIFFQLVVIVGLVRFIMVSLPFNVIENLSLSSSEYVFGIDISHYQYKINWEELRTSHHPIEFIFIRATMGKDGIDRRFEENWKSAGKHKYLRGAYHYYRPNENSTEQFENYQSNVILKKGDFIPILDIEKESKLGDENLRKGVLNWLKLAEQKYGVKPMVYTGLDFYNLHLKGFIDDYPIWIAAYSGKDRLGDLDWTFHQFTENVKIKGIRTSVDGNEYKGALEDLKKMCMK